MENLHPNDVCILSYARTPVGAFQGSLSALPATALGAVAIKGAVERAKLSPDMVDEVVMGNVISSNLGQAPASTAARLAGLPPTIPCTVVNKVCSSGLKAIMLAAQTIMAGQNDIVIAGGMESMSNSPHLMPAVRSGVRLGDTQLVDALLRDGLTDAGSGKAMGECAELCAEKYQIGRETQDDHAVESFVRAQQAASSGLTTHEIVAVDVPGARRGQPGRLIAEDEAIYRLDAKKLRNLRPYFKTDGGSVTAGNASSLADGAAAVVLGRASVAQRLGLPILGRIRGFADANQEPEWFSTSPALAIPKALQRSGVSAGDISYWEINEAFSVVDLVNRHLLKLDPTRVNAFGGSVALGHPIGCSGARVVVTLMNVLRAKGEKLGGVGVCNGGGGASALILESFQPVAHTAL